MSVEHEACVVVGFFVDKDKFFSPLQDGDVWRFAEKEYTDVNELMSDFENIFNAEFRVFGNAFSGDEYGLAIEPKGFPLEKGGYTFAQVAAMEGKCKELKAALSKVGLDAGEANIFSMLDIY